MHLDHFRTFARYNRWANDKLYAACATLSEAEYLKPRESFFGSIHATLNHILVGDRIWLGRLTNHDPGIKALDQMLYADFAGLKVARGAEDAQIIAFVDGLDEPMLNSALRYKTSSEKTYSNPVRWVLAHLFNHQTHHRGQAHGLLSQTAVKPPALDLMHYLREASAA